MTHLAKPGTDGTWCGRPVASTQVVVQAFTNETVWACGCCRTAHKAAQDNTEQGLRQRRDP